MKAPPPPIVSGIHLRPKAPLNRSNRIPAESETSRNRITGEFASGNPVRQPLRITSRAATPLTVALPLMEFGLAKGVIRRRFACKAHSARHGFASLLEPAQRQPRFPAEPECISLY